MVFKHEKRPFSEDELCHISFKHPRQLDYTSFVGFLPCNNSPKKPRTADCEGERGFKKFQDEERFVSDKNNELSVAVDKELENFAFGSFSGLSWVTGSTCEEDARSESTFQDSCMHGFYDIDPPPRTSSESEGVSFSTLMDYPLRKLVSIGPDHQADVPKWSSEGPKKASDCVESDQGFRDSDSHIASPPSSVPFSVPFHCAADDNREQLMGTCIIPMPDADSFSYYNGRVGTDCNCIDEGSIRCTRHHIMEAREKLRLTLGEERFVELGFCDMGEDVARKWSEEDEQVFHEVVFSNPVSLGKNFWDHLPAVFPTKSREELVSYYFNVFMLRRRAEQNRLDPFNIDSDNDEWQASDDGEEFGITEEDEDSVVESPADQGNTIYDEDAHKDGYHEDDDEDDDDDDDDDDDEGGAGGVAAVEDDVGRLDDASKLHFFSIKPSMGKSFDCHDFVPTDQHTSNDLQNGSEEQDVADDSCTSYECQPSGAITSGPSNDAGATQVRRVEADHKTFHSVYGNGSFCGMADHGYVLEPSDARVWDAGFFTGTKNNFDFLPTCSMIEEVFGDETWNNKDLRDSPRIS